jgi:hypothetical protein
MNDLTRAEARALERGGFSLAPADLGTEDPLARTAAEYAALLKASLATADLAARLGVDPSRIRQRLTARPPTLYGIRLESGWVIPQFQLDAGRLIPGLVEVVPQLDSDLHPLTVLRWFTTPNPDLLSDEHGGRSTDHAVCLGLTTSHTASGCLATICRRILAGPAGVRRPCSQFWRVSTLMPSNAANSACERSYASRISLTSGTST